ncbi:MAG: nucleotidyltransferase domain-containing protein [Planctomycetes bacterium]|nr:nucleotidyltransferase domain-containing protein [Planctomycetota bacterium]
MVARALRRQESRSALFGSRARGQGHKDSDLDVLVVIDDLTSAERRCGSTAVTS